MKYSDEIEAFRSDLPPLTRSLAGEMIFEDAVQRLRAAFKASIVASELAALLLTDFVVPEAFVYAMQREREALVDATPDWP